MITLKIKDKEYKVKVADTEELREKGLQEETSLSPNEGMLFCFDEPDEVSFWMKDTPINLDIIFIGEDDKVLRVATGYADSEKAHTQKDCMHVLELAQGSGVKAGDKVEVEDDDIEDDSEEEDEDSIADMDEEEQKMIILNAKGKSQMELDGGERIFSRKNTISLLKFAKRAYETKSTSSYKTLGKKLFAFLDTQDNREPDYVETPK